MLLQKKSIGFLLFVPPIESKKATFKLSILMHDKRMHGAQA